MLRDIPLWTSGTTNSATATHWMVLDPRKEEKFLPSWKKFDIYRFTDYKEKVIDLLARVTTVRVETVRIAKAMKQAIR